MLAPICLTSRRPSVGARLLRRLLQLSASAALAMLISSSAMAQPTRPAEAPRSNDPTYRNNNGQNGDFPTGDIHAAVEANARLTYARVTYHNLQHQLDQAINKVVRDFEKSPELIEALKIEQSAWEDYLAARHEALKDVEADPNYQATVALKNDMSEKIAEVRTTYENARPRDPRAAVIMDRTEMKKIVTLATVKLDYARVATDMEVAALKKDSKVADTRTKLLAAGKRVHDLREAFDTNFRNNPELAALRAKVEDARVAFITAESFRDGAVEAANTALDYAYYKNRYGNSYSYEFGTYGGYRQ